MPAPTPPKAAPEATKPSPALQFILHVWNHCQCRGKSHQRFNHALYAALKTAIEGQMDFAAGDIAHLYKHCRAGYWITSGGEVLYALACGKERGSGNPSAALAFETAYERPAWLWPEDTKTPERLYVGSQLTLQGHRVTVTSFNDANQSLVACTYKDNDRHYNYHYGPDKTVHVGLLHYEHGDYRMCEVWKETEDGSLVTRFGPVVKNYHKSSIERRFTITHEALMGLRKTFDATRRKHEKAFKAATTIEELETAKVACAAEPTEAFRHFDRETLRDAFTARWQQILDSYSPEERYKVTEDLKQARAREAAEALPKWLAGEDVAVNRFDGPVRCRIKNGRVQVSTGDSVTLSGAKEALAFALQHRKTGWTRTDGTSGAMCDGHPINAVTAKHVVIGCTTFPWSEIDRLAPQIQSA